jgi:Cupredoxin-like domain
VQNLLQKMRTRFISGTVVFCFVFISAGSAIAAAPAGGKVEIVIRNYTFEFQGGTLRPNEPGTILLRNLDKVQHGFTSPVLAEQEVRVESSAGIAYGKGINGVYINPGETLKIHLIPNRAGSFPFRCDIHPKMKGEFLILSVEGVKYPSSR